MAQRTCIITGETDDSSNLIRFVISPDGSLTPDLAEKLSGRGAYIMPKPEYIAEALKKNKFAKHIDFQKKISLEEIDLFTALVGNLLQRRFVEQLSLARRQGSAIAGAGKLKENASLIGLLISNDASVREARQLESATNPNWVMRDIPAETLGEAFGRNSNLRKVALSLHNRACVVTLPFLVDIIFVLLVFRQSEEKSRMG